MITLMLKINIYNTKPKKNVYASENIHNELINTMKKKLKNI